jgi:beta-lactamase regulating signal transducer with metallopeptidase domain
MNLTHLSAGVASVAVVSVAVVLAVVAAVVLIQTTFVLGIGLAVTRLARRRGAAVESACQRIVLCAALVAPLASALVGLAVARVRIPVPVFEEVALRAPTDDTRQAPLGPPRSQPPDDRLMSDAERPEPASLSQREDHRSRSPAPRLIHTPEKTSDALAARPAANRESWLRAAAVTFCATWFCVAAVLIGRLAGSHFGAWRLISAAIEVEPELIERCRMLADQIGVRLPHLKCSPFVAGPCVFGWRRPTILLPESEAHIDDDVLIHELAHVARRDGFWKTLSEGIVALLWFQPLLWRLKSRMQFCAEEVCDDFVVQFGTDRCAYADRLTRIAEEFAARSREFRIEQVGIGIVSFRSSLGRRVCRILDSRRRLTVRAGRKMVAGLICGAAAVIFAVSLFEFDRQPARLHAADEPAKVSTNTEPGPAARSDVPRQPAGSTKIKLVPSKEANGDVVSVRGTVLRPDGGPAAGARIAVIHSAFFNQVGTYRPIAAVSSGPDGTFEAVYRKSQYGKKPNEADQWEEITLLVEAEGLASHWIDFMDFDAAKPLVFKLVPDFPIRGRLVDLQGKGAAGVEVTLFQVFAPRTPMPPRDRSYPWAVADGEGRFEIRGLAAGVRVDLTIHGESIGFDRLEVVTRHMPPIPPKPGAPGSAWGPTYGAEFTCIAPPGRAIEGTVRDAATGKPLARARVQIWALATRHVSGLWDTLTLTDEKGHYRLASLPFGKRNRILVTPNDEQPYFVREVVVPNWREAGPKTVDVELHRGIWITGKATDKVTGKPVFAELYYLPFLANPFAQKLPKTWDRALDGYQERYRTRPDGSFRLVGLPGHAIVGARTPEESRYRAGFGASKIGGMDKDGRFDTYFNPVYACRTWPDTMQEINPREGVDEVKCDLVFDPGQTIHAYLVDGKGKPIDGAMVLGAAATGRIWPKPAAHFDIVGLVPGDKRRIMIYHLQSRVGKYFLLEYTDKSPHSMTITLEPCAILKGRAVDQDSIGVNASVRAVSLPNDDFSPATEAVDTQRDGKFECIVPAGCQYDLVAETRRFDRGLVRQISVEAGKTIDVGDVKIRPRKR